MDISIEHESPLVSVCVITYNSSRTLVETLESVKRQTYENIELIVSDDASSDCTIELCESWINTNRSRFVRIELVTSEYNTGTSANCNRAVNHSTGLWIKPIAGDDILLDNCIEDNIIFINRNAEAKVIFSDYIKFSINRDNSIVENMVDSTNMYRDFFTADPFSQHKQILYKNVIPAYTTFISASIFSQYSYDERFKYLEDEPLWVKLTGDGIKLYSFPKYTVKYRIAESISKSSRKFYSPLFYDSLQRFFWIDKYERIRLYDLKEAYDVNKKAFLYYDIANLLFSNQKNWLSVFIMHGFSFLMKHFLSFKME